MSFVYPAARAAAWTGALDLETAALKALLLGASTTAAADTDAAVLSDFAALAESDAAGYSRQALSGVTVTSDADGAAMGADDLDFGVLAGASEAVVAILVIADNGGPGSDLPVAYLNEVEAASIAFPYVPIGRQLEALFPGGKVLDL